MNIIKQLKDVNGNNIYPIAYAQGGMKMDLLWTNPSPTASFSAQTISLDLSEYSAIILLAKPVATDFQIASFVIPTDNTTEMTLVCSNHANRYRRTTISQTGITFGSGGYWNTYASTTASASDNSFIPYKIYGIKTSYVVPTSVHGLQYVEV